MPNTPYLGNSQSKKSRQKKDSDKERILKNIILYLSNEAYEGNKWVTIRSGDSVEKGAIIRCLTNPNHAHGISRYHSRILGGLMLQEIGHPKNLCRMTNEVFQKLVGMPYHMSTEGFEHKMVTWGHKSLSERYNKETDYFNVRPYDVRLIGVSVLRIMTRPHIFINPSDHMNQMYKPRTYMIPVNKKTRLKDICSSLLEKEFNKEWTFDEIIDRKDWVDPF
jgi:hypothetical protein